MLGGINIGAAVVWAGGIEFDILAKPKRNPAQNECDDDRNDQTRHSTLGLFRIGRREGYMSLFFSSAGHIMLTEKTGFQVL
ncbi:MAG: hypothetical protein ACYSOG_01075 [Planctomycetota bacterium]